MENKILVVDLETSDFLDKGGKIVEVGLVELDITTGARAIVYDSLVLDPTLDCSTLHQSWICVNKYISPVDIFTAPSLVDESSKIQSIIDSYSNGMTAFNKRFDFGFLEANGFSIPKKLACPMEVATNICKIPKTGKAKFYPGYKWPNVEEAYAFFFPGEEYQELHRGADDAFHEAKIVYELIARGKIIV